MSETPSKPSIPENCGAWWNSKLSELPADLAEIKKEYYRQYYAWKRAQKPPPSPKPEKDLKMLPGVKQWWNKPGAELTPEQREFRRKYRAENFGEYNLRYQANLREKARLFDEMRRK